MKKTIATLILLVLGTGISQAQLLEFGVKGGVNFANYNGEDNLRVDFLNLRKLSYWCGDGIKNV
jgi:hypothetical protein